MKTPSRFLLIFSIITAVAWAQAAKTPRAVGKDLGAVAGAQVETLPAQQLFALASQHGAAPVVVLAGKVTINENVTDYYRWIYDRDQRVLVQLRRTAMRTVDDHFAWVLWRNIGPEAFRERLPFLDESLKPTLSPFKNAKATIPLSYPGNPEIAVWP